MAQGSRVPKFGGWGSGEDAPSYTTYFNRAREGRGAGKMINPNDPQQNQHMIPNSTGNRVEPEPIRNGVRGHVRRVSREGGEFVQVNGYAARNDNTGRRAAGDQSLQRRHGARGGGSGGRPVKQNAKSQQRINSANRGDETPDGGAFVPVFGDWNLEDPDSENLTDKFQRVRDENRNGPGKLPGPLDTPSSSFTTKQNPNTDDSAKCTCFPWGRK